jgi:hypothetical protein
MSLASGSLFAANVAAEKLPTRAISRLLFAIEDETQISQTRIRHTRERFDPKKKIDR